MKQIIKKIKKLGFRLGIKKLIGYEAIFSCAFCKREKGAELYTGADSREKEFMVLPHSEKYWYADPLLYEKDGKEVVFLERVDRKTGRGCIACADLSKGQWTEPVPVIEESFHMSFPMCFTWGRELYMMPETEMSGQLNLYRSTQIPYGWEKAGEFLQGVKLVDSIILEQDENKILFLASEYKKDDDFYTRFHEYEMEKADGTIFCRDMGRKNEDYALNARTAGPMIEDKGRLIPLQRSTSGIYGYSVQFTRYEGKLTGKFHGKLLGKIEKELLPENIRIKGRKLIGVHTYSQSDHYEMIDIQYLVFNKNKWRRKRK